MSITEKGEDGANKREYLSGEVGIPQGWGKGRASSTAQKTHPPSTTITAPSKCSDGIKAARLIALEPCAKSSTSGGAVTYRNPILRTTASSSPILPKNA